MPHKPITLFSLLLSAIMLTAAVGPAVAAPAPSDTLLLSRSTTAAEYSPDAEECSFLAKINAYRAATNSNLAPLTLLRTLGAAADHHSIDMANHNYFSHTLYDGTTWSQNIKNHGYDYIALGTSAGENIAAGTNSATADAVFTQWKTSSTHNANMLSSSFKAIGIGRAYNAGSTYDWYWTTTFGGKVSGDTVSCSGGSNPAPTPTPSPTSVPISGQPLKIVRSGRSSGSLSSAYAYDGNPATNWHTTRSTPPTSAYLYFDLGGTKSISAINWMFAQTGSADSWKIQISTNRTTWTTIESRGNANAANTWQTFAWSGTTRYVRFYFTNPNKDKVLGYVAEVQILS
jgi:uncharacterized protein YkwD